MITPRLKNIFLYGSAITTIIIGTALLVAIARGYRYDFLNRRITQTGLVIIDSKPNGATIYVNDYKISQKTPYRIEAANIGEMTIKLQRNGYRDWFRRFTVRPEEVSFLDYAWLLPTTLDYDQPLPNVKPTRIVQSGDHRKTFYTIKTDTDISVWQYLGQSTPQRIYTAPPAVGPNPIKDIDSVQVNTDGSQLQFRLLTDGDSPTIIKNVGANESYNIADIFKIKSGSIYLNPNNRNEPLWLDNGRLTRLNLDGKTISAPLAENVTAVKLKVDKVVYSTVNPETKKTERYFSTTSLERSFRLNLPDETDTGAFTFDYSRFRDTDYVYCLSQSTKKLYIIADPTSGSARTSVYGQAVTSFIISPSSRYVMTNNRGRLNTYDFELGYYYSNDAAKLDDLRDWLWVDDNHIIAQTNNAIRLIDYDGYNDQTVSQSGDTITGIAYQFDTKSVTYRSDNRFKQVLLLKR